VDLTDVSGAVGQVDAGAGVPGDAAAGGGDEDGGGLADRGGNRGGVFALAAARPMVADTRVLVALLATALAVNDALETTCVDRPTAEELSVLTCRVRVAPLS